MRIEKWSATDTVATREIYDVYQAMRATDDPAGPPLTWHRARLWLENPRMPTELWVTRDEGTSAISAFCWLELPQQENRHRGEVLLVVHPEHRRRGTGTALLRHLAGRATANERTVLGTSLAQDSPGAAFARRQGATPGLERVRRALPVTEESRARATALRATAARKAAGYSLVSWSGPAPDEFIDRVANLHTAMGDAPHGEGVEEARWDADRVRREIYDVVAAVGGRRHEVAAVHDATGELAALTAVDVDPEVPQWGMQGVTVATRSHRGHRLGLLVKTAMLDRLAADEPALRHIFTDNAAANDHMIAINEALGFQILKPLWQEYELPVTTVPALAPISLISDIRGERAQVGSTVIASPGGLQTYPNAQSGSLPSVPVRAFGAARTCPIAQTGSRGTGRAAGGGASVDGWYRIGLPDRENLADANVTILAPRREPVEEM